MLHEAPDVAHTGPANLGAEGRLHLQTKPHFCQLSNTFLQMYDLMLTNSAVK